jgi:hypothetical protein
MIKKSIALLLTVALLGCSASARTLDRDERWSGEVRLAEDVIVPTGRTLTIEPATRVVTQGNKIISYGDLNILGEAKNKVEFLHLRPAGNEDVAVVRVKPYNVDTQILKDEFTVFRVQYAILWSVIFASIFIMVEAR